LKGGVFGSKLWFMSALEQVWRERVTEWRASGMNRNAFCRGKAYTAHSLGSWVRRLSGLDIQSEPKVITLKPVVTPSRPLSRNAVVLERGDIRVTVTQDTDLTLLRSVMAALTRELA
jgi:hypothetical protein